MPHILIVGGAGYIGGITTSLLHEAGYDITVLDNLSTGHRHNLPETVTLVEGNMCNKDIINKLFQRHTFDTVINFAAKILPSESMEDPGGYFYNNVYGTANIIDMAARYHVAGFVFSSTAAVYGNPERIPIQENDSKHPINPYGVSKYMVEQLLQSYENTHELPWCALRYFNAAGAHYNIGPEYPFKTHILPVAIDKLRRRETMQIFGNDYDTPDGTCVRDYVHAYDIALAHLYAVEKLLNGATLNKPVNLGNSTGHSVLEIIHALENVTSQNLSYEYASRRAGDPDKLVASNDLAYKLLGWEPTKNLDQIIEDAWQWTIAKSL